MRLSRRGGVFAGRRAVALDYAAEVLADNPFAYWRFEETSGSTVADEVGTNDGTVFGANLNVTGQVGSGISYDGTDDYSSHTTLGALWSGIGTTGLTVEFWIKTVTAANGRGLCGFFNDGFNTGMQLATNWNSTADNTAGSTYFQFRQDGSAQSRGAFDGAAVYSGNWTHVVLVREAGSAPTHHAYVNGSAATVTLNGNDAGTNFANAQYPLAFGARNNRGTFDLHSAIDLDEIAIYDEVLSAARILAHYNAGVA